MKSKKAYFAGGCFWCMEPPYANLEGVESVMAGYSGGKEEHPTYDKVAYGLSEHREAIQITYDPLIVDYKKLLEVFWQNIDPTDEGGQFADRGRSYKTAIYYQSESEKKSAEKSKKDLEESRKFDQPIVTEILPYSNFFPAEDEHQQYYLKNPMRYSLYKKGSGREGFLEEKWG